MSNSTCCFVQATKCPVVLRRPRVPLVHRGRRGRANCSRLMARAFLLLATFIHSLCSNRKRYLRNHTAESSTFSDPEPLFSTFAVRVPSFDFSKRVPTMLVVIVMLLWRCHMPRLNPTAPDCTRVHWQPPLNTHRKSSAGNALINRRRFLWVPRRHESLAFLPSVNVLGTMGYGALFVSVLGTGSVRHSFALCFLSLTKELSALYMHLARLASDEDTIRSKYTALIGIDTPPSDKGAPSAVSNAKGVFHPPLSSSSSSSHPPTAPLSDVHHHHSRCRRSWPDHHWHISREAQCMLNELPGLIFDEAAGFLLAEATCRQPWM